MRILFLVVLLLLPVELPAAPYLAANVPADPGNIQAGEIEQTYGGQVTTLPALLQVRGTDYLLLDLDGKSGGRYQFRARYQDKSGWWSDWSPFLDAGKPAASGVLKIVP